MLAIPLIEMLVYRDSLDILNEQLEYILLNYSFSKEGKENLYNFLSKIHNNFNVNEIYSNGFKNEYNFTKSAIDKAIIGGTGNLDLAPQNFIYNYDKTIKILKNTFYFSYINKDFTKSQIIKNALSNENRLSNIYRYNGVGNTLVAISYISFDGYFESLEKTKLNIEKIINLLKNK